MTLEQLLNRFDSVDRSLVVVNRTDPDPVLHMLTDTFGERAVDVIDGTTPRLTESFDDASHGAETARSTGSMRTAECASRKTNGGSGTTVPETLEIDIEALAATDVVSFDGDTSVPVENLVLLVEDETVIAGATLAELGDAVLFVNSDLYMTGSRTLDEIELPSVITGLSDTTFTLQGYPESNRQKLLLITISRFIERVAWNAGDGTLRSSFQRLSRLDDEVGTKHVYDRVATTGVDTHLYGVPDEVPRDLDAVIHGGTSPDFTDSWFVVYRPPAGATGVPAADESDLQRGIKGGVGLLAVETAPRVWRGCWTFDPDRVHEINRYIERRL